MLRSRALVGAVQDGRVDLAIVRKDAIANASPQNCHPVTTLSFHLCIPRQLLPKGATADTQKDASQWSELPFAAGRDGGQLDQAIRDAMARAGVDFRPRFECGSMLQLRQLLVQESCAAVLPNLAVSGLDEEKFLVIPFAPLGDYGRALVLHWNPRQMERRGLEPKHLLTTATLIAR